MNVRGTLFLRVAVVTVGALAAFRAEAQLAAKSPFMNTGAGGSAAPTAGAPLEFRGTMETAEGVKVRIVDPARHNTGVWLRVDERDPAFDFVVKKIDAEHDTVTLDYQGRPLTLAQHVAKVASAGAPQNFPAMQNPAAMPMPAAITSSVVVNPTPADEQRRLEAVAAEVARRRALREQAAQQVNQGVAVAPQVIQQQQELRAQQQGAQQQNNGGQRGNFRPQRGNRGP